MTQDYSNHKKAMTSAEAYVRGNLPTIASEVIDWHRTGIVSPTPDTKDKS
jgi:hypothetical protein